MSDHETEANPTGQESQRSAPASFSTNGSEPTVQPPDALTGEGGDDGTSFLADLARAMQSTAAAEQARDAELTDQRRQAHIDAIRAREAIEAEDLRELAKEDVKGIDAWSDGEIKRIKLERERRIAARREQLHQRLEEHRTVVAREVEAVEAAVARYRDEIEQFFRRLEWESDPVAIARQAGTRPAFPVLELIGPDDGAGSNVRVTDDGPAMVGTMVGDEAAADAAAEGHAAADGTPDPLIGSPSVERPAPRVATPWGTDSEAIALKKAIGDDATRDEAGDAAEDASADEEPVPGVASEGSSEAVEGAAVESEAPTADSDEADGSPEPVLSDGSDEAILSDGSDETVSDDAEAPQTVGVVAEALVVTPRNTSAGSWLRWPSASADRSDPTH